MKNHTATVRERADSGFRVGHGAAFRSICCGAVVTMLLVCAAYSASAEDGPSPSSVAAPPIGPTVRVLHIDGTTVEGNWVRIVHGRSLALISEDGPLSLPLDELQRINFDLMDLKSKPVRPGGRDSRTGRPVRTSDQHRLEAGAAQSRVEVGAAPSPDGTSDAASSDRAGRIEDVAHAADASAKEQRTEKDENRAAPKLLRVTLDLADGGQLDGRLTDGEGETLVVDSVLGDGIAVKLDRLAGVQFSNEPTYQAASRAYLDALSKRRSAEDVLITLDEEDPRVLPGRIERVARHPDDAVFIIDFLFGGRSRTVRFDRLFGIVFAAGVGELPTFPATFELRDGTIVSGRITDSDAKSLTAETSLDAAATLPLDGLRSIRLRSDRVVYVSDLPIISERTEGMLHRPWPVRRDRNVMGGPLSIAGRTFEKGIGCHSLTELRYKLGGRYESFAATVGIDDHVRPGGAVVFRVMGDGEVLWDSGSVTGRDEPRDVVVEVLSVNELTLLVDFGEGLDLSDHANWGAARLLRPAKSPADVQ